MSISLGPLTPNEAYWSHVTELMDTLKGTTKPTLYNEALVVLESDFNPELDEYKEKRESLLRGLHTLRTLFFFIRLPNIVLQEVVGMDSDSFRDEIGNDFFYPNLTKIESNLEYVIDKIRSLLEKLRSNGDEEMTFFMLKPRVPYTKVLFKQLLNKPEKKLLCISEQKNLVVSDLEFQARIIADFDDLRFQALAVLGVYGQSISAHNLSREEASKWLAYERGAHEKCKDDPIAISLARQVMLDVQVKEILSDSYTVPGIGVDYVRVEKDKRKKRGKLFPIRNDIRANFDAYVDWVCAK